MPFRVYTKQGTTGVHYFLFYLNASISKVIFLLKSCYQLEAVDTTMAENYSQFRMCLVSLGQCFPEDVQQNPRVSRNENKGSRRKFQYSIQNYNLNVVLKFFKNKFHFGVSLD